MAKKKKSEDKSESIPVKNIDKNAMPVDFVKTEKVETQEENAAAEGKERVLKPEKAEKDNLSTNTEELELDINDLKDQLLRKQADYVNFKKRIAKEKEESIRYANQMLLLDIVAVIDDFERAIASADESKDFTDFHSGIVLIEKQLTSMLEKKWGLRRFDSLGEEFNPDKHQAIAIEEDEDSELPIVKEDYQKGYFYHERVLRPAKVKVSQPKIKVKADNIGKEEAGESQGD